MKQIVVVGDLHLHFWKAFASGHGVENSRFQNTLRNLRASLQAARELNCPWAQVGDQVHTIGFTHNTVLTALIDLLIEYNDVEKFVVWGNHDARSKGDKISKEETVSHILWKAVPSVTLLQGFSSVARNGLTIYGEGYQPNLENLVIQTRPPNEQFDVGLFHQTVADSLLPSGLKMEHGLPREWLFRHFRLAVVGDVHRPQSFVSTDGRCSTILVPGSLEQHNFGDLEERGWWICGVPNEGDDTAWAVPQMVLADSPRFLTVETAAGVKPDGNFYRITSPCDPSEIPEGAVVSSSPKSAVTQRDIIQPGSSVTDILNAWMGMRPPQGDHAEYLQSGLQFLGAEIATALRPMRLNSVQSINFLCFSEALFEIKDGVTLVTGKGRDYASNGAGKTTLFESIFWALFGRTTKGVEASDVIRYGESSCSVELRFDGLVVRRVRRSDGTSELMVQSQTGHPADGQGVTWKGSTKEIGENLRKYLGLTPELYQALAYFSQSKLVLFSQATDSERKGMLSDLCGLDVYQKAASYARAAAQVRDGEIAQSSATIAVLERSVSAQEEECARLETQIREWDCSAEQGRHDAAGGIVVLEEKIAGLEKSHTDARLAQDALVEQAVRDVLLEKAAIEEKHRGQMNSSLSDEEESYKKWVDARPNLPERNVLETRKVEIQVLQKANGDELTTFRTLLGELKAERRTAQLKLDSAKKMELNCPTCGKPMDTAARDEVIRSSENFLSSSENRLAELTEKERSAHHNLETYTQQIRQLDGLILQVDEQARRERQHLDTVAGIEAMINTQVPRLVEEEINVKQKLVRARMESTFTPIEQEFRSKIEQCKNGIRDLTRRINELKVNPYQRNLEHAAARREDLLKELAVTQDSSAVAKKNKAICTYWGEAFSRSGIQSLLMEEIAGSFNQMRSLVFPLLTNGVFDVQFATTSQTKEGESREKSDFIIRYRDGLVSYESLSGGQRRRIDLGVMLTLALAVARTRNIPGVFGLLILDEVFGFLDDDGAESLYSVLGEVNKVIPSIYAITHDSALQSLFSNTISVEQDAFGVSTLH